MLIKKDLGLVEITCGLVHASYSLPEWQAVKLTFFAPWVCHQRARVLRKKKNGDNSDLLCKTHVMF